MRNEYKYIIHNSLMDKIRQRILPYLTLDKFAIGKENNQYTVRSIYFDNPSLEFYYEKIEGLKNRKKIRLRGYGKVPDQDNTVFLEIKRKYDVPLLKNRAILTYGEALKMFKNLQLNGYSLQDERLPKSIDSAKRFFYHLNSKNLRPVVLVVYEREAYLDRFDPTVRVTFDKNLRSYPFPAINELYEETKTLPVLDNSFIMEVKFNDHFPYWITPTVSEFSLVRRSASKYTMCIDRAGIPDGSSKNKVLMNSKWLI